MVSSLQNGIVAAEGSPPSFSQYALLHTCIDKGWKKWYNVLHIIDSLHIVLITCLSLPLLGGWPGHQSADSSSQQAENQVASAVSTQHPQKVGKEWRPSLDQLAVMGENSVRHVFNLYPFLHYDHNLSH